MEEKADTQFFLCLTSYLEIFFSENNELKLELNAFIVAIDTFETLKIFLDELILYVSSILLVNIKIWRRWPPNSINNDWIYLGQLQESAFPEC